eukprot:gene7249-3872_t
MVDPDKFKMLKEEDFEYYLARHVKRGKSGGRLGLVYDLMKLAPQEARRWFFHTYYKWYAMGMAECIPGTKDSVSTLLPKPGDYTMPQRLRMIGLQAPPHQIADGLQMETGRREITRVAERCLHSFLQGRWIFALVSPWTLVAMIS